MLNSLLMKAGMLAVTAALVLWIGWPVPKEPATDPSPPASQEQRAEPQGTAKRASVSNRATAGRTITEPQKTSQTSAITPTKGSKWLDINRATVQELQALPGIGEVLARRVVEQRKARGSFRAVEDLLEVKGIGEKRLNSLRPLILVGNQIKTSYPTTESAEPLIPQGKGRL